MCRHHRVARHLLGAVGPLNLFCLQDWSRLAKDEADPVRQDARGNRFLANPEQDEQVRNDPDDGPGSLCCQC